MSKVYLAGAGPGDPELITLKCRRVLEQADAVLYDHLANEALLDLAPAAAERIYVGKKRAEHVLTQAEIVAMLIARARAGQTVVRLKGGDPFIFCRGGEEAEALAEAGVDFEVIPGVTAPLGIAAYTGVPLTHREHTSVVTLLTGHDPSLMDWSKVSGSETLVIYMGLTHIGEIVERLIENGRDPMTPAMAVRWGTRPEQQTIAAPLRDLPQAVASAAMKPPATVIIGEVVRLRDRLNWYERLPLFGQRVVITRAQGQAGEMASKLRSLGADAVELPAIAIHPAADYTALDGAIAKLEQYDWLIFTSANGVRFFLDRLDRSPSDPRALRGKICAIGPATRSALEQAHLKADVMPETYVAEALVAALDPYDLNRARVLLPRAAVARDVIPIELGRRGALVDVVEAYRTQAPEFAHQMSREVFSKKADWVTFTSSSTVRNFLAIAGRGVLEGVRIASIGPVTSDVLRKHGLEVTVEAEEFTIDGLVRAIVSAG